MAPNLSEDEIDDLLYYARTGDLEEFATLRDELCKRENIGPGALAELLRVAKDENSGNGVLHMAAANGHEGFIKDICKRLSHPSPQNPAMLEIINAQNNSGNTALHWAALNGHLEAVKVLLEQGADPTICNQRGHDAVYEAELNDKTDVVEWVLKEGGEGLEEGLGGENNDAQEEQSNDTEMGSGAGDEQKELEDEVNRMDIKGEQSKE
ncbi:ankyrin repeat-containing domain protein [Xylogone sp. PMI_703]|nr:ankyrin repeat-containing domain protein [Xylogone sp. PMI_703]